MLPDVPVIRLFGLRALILWIGTRLMAAAALALAGGDPVRLTFGSAVLIVGSAVALCFADVRRRHERALLENLGVPRTVQLALFATPALLGELAISLVVAQTQ